MNSDEIKPKGKHVCKDIVISKAEMELDSDGGILYDKNEVLRYLEKKYITFD